MAQRPYVGYDQGRVIAPCHIDDFQELVGYAPGGLFYIIQHEQFSISQQASRRSVYANDVRPGAPF